MICMEYTKNSYNSIKRKQPTLLKWQQIKMVAAKKEVEFAPTPTPAPLSKIKFTCIWGAITL